MLASSLNRTCSRTVQRLIPSRMRYFSTPSTSGSVSDIEKRRKMLLWRARSRGWLELDVLMGTFTAKHVHSFDDAKLDLLDEVLEMENPDLFKWFTGQAKVPDEVLQENEVLKLLVEYVKSDNPELDL